MSFPVLLIDDDVSMSTALHRSLVLSFEVECANSGTAALDLLKEGRGFPVIVTDLRMPGMDGIEFIQAAREYSSDSVFLVLTGNHDVGAAGYIESCDSVFLTILKPAKKADLISKIEMAYGEYQKRIANAIKTMQE